MTVPWPQPLKNRNPAAAGAGLTRPSGRPIGGPGIGGRDSLMATRVIIIGAGLAGMMAAFHASREGAEVFILDRGSAGLGTNSAMANGVFAGPTAMVDEGRYEKETMEIGRMINKRAAVGLVAREARRAIRSLESFGLTITELPNSYTVRPASPGVIPGVTMVKRLRDRVLSGDRVTMITGFYATGILTKDGRATGVEGFDRNGELHIIPGDAVILATGGAGAVYLNHDNQKNILGQGFLLAAQAGLPLLDMEFLQFYPLVISGPGLPSMIIYPPCPEGTVLRTSSGNDLVAEQGLGSINQAVVVGRDRFSLILHRELAKGPVTMDFSSVSEAAWHDHPMAILSRLRFDCRHHPVPVAPAVHFCMGGIEADDRCETAIKGLFGCGEVLWGLHGANRRGGNALTECVVTGSIAGREAAHAAGRGKGSAGDTVTQGPGTTNSKAGTSGPFREILRRIRSIAWEQAGLVRTSDGMNRGLVRLREVEEALDRTGADHVRAMAAQEDCRAALFCVKAILTAGRDRRESRGAFMRSDYPEEDNRSWKKNSCLLYDQQTRSFSVTYRETR